ncbi:hypothetical protein CFIMG_007689RA00001 [Ceratocystis fimbriata CBS 114723]|uniref:Uncharacterized protein n=1 Tax=Ceratocystis fimbriata CBS 114723 TaxID=1035309 RepID=A0A2C5X4T0_9PEZI|nr:hypothetical protein CFIMG_007689RA00001 [Ceratocystis fimbriata CBS 114723]
MWTIFYYLSLALVWAYQLAEPQNWPFIFVFCFKFVRAIIHQFAYTFLSRPCPIPANPTYRASDATIIVPTVDPLNVDFAECIRTTLEAGPGEMIVVTVGKGLLASLTQAMEKYRVCFPSTKIRVCAIDEANKRKQISAVIASISTKITVLVDDHVFWPSRNFLTAIVAPFEDPSIGGVATIKKVRRTAPGHFNFAAFWNMLGAIYLERHNFEIQSTNAIDGGIFVISGRTCVYRTQIFQNESFQHNFTEEMFFLGKYGPLNADDDNFITREIVKAGWKIKVQNHPDARIVTTVGTYPKFLSQCLRWARTTWRSNPASMFTDDRSCWWRTPWTSWAVFVYTLFNFSLAIDSTLMFGLTRTTWYVDADSSTRMSMLVGLVLWISAFKAQKLAAYFGDHPRDIGMFPLYILWAYYHSFIKLYSMFTFFDVVWGGRDLSKVSSNSKDATLAATTVTSSDRVQGMRGTPISDCPCGMDSDDDDEF